MNNRVKEIITDVEALSNWSVEIDPCKEGKTAQEIILALKATMKEHNLVSLSAPQIGYNRRIFCLRFGDNDYRTFVNPAIENNSGMTMSRETCTSIPDKQFIIPRFGKIKFFYTTPMGKVESGTLVGRAAYVFQHAMDHLNGVLVSDIGLEIDELFDQATDDERAEVLKMYAESLDIRAKELNKEIEEDKDLRDINNAIKFINSVKDGSTKLENVETEKDKKQ